MSSLVIGRLALVVGCLSTEGFAQLGWAHDTHTLSGGPHMRARYATTLILFVSHNYVCEPFRSTHKHLLASEWSRAQQLRFWSYETLIIHLVCHEWVAVCVDFDGIAPFFLQPSSGLGGRAGDSRDVVWVVNPEFW